MLPLLTVSCAGPPQVGHGRSIEKKPEAFWMMFHKARILKIMGMKKEAINTANAVIDLASDKKDDYGYIQKSKDLIASFKKK